MSSRTLSILLVVSLIFLVEGCAKKVQSPSRRDYLATADSYSLKTSPDQTTVTAEEKFSSGADEQADARGDSPARQVKVGKVLVLPSISNVDLRMTVYADKLSDWETLSAQLAEAGITDQRPPRWDGCQDTIGRIFQGYSMLMEALLKYDKPVVDAEKFGVDPWAIYQDDVTFLESGCEQVFMTGASRVRGWTGAISGGGMAKNEAVVAQYAEEGFYEEAVTAFESMVASDPEMVVSINTRKLYGMALLRTGRVERAVAILSQVLADMPPSHEERSLRRLVADLLLASGRLEDATGNYRQLAAFFESRKGDDRWVADQLAMLTGVSSRARELPIYMDVLQGYLMFDGRHIPVDMKDMVERMEDDFPASLMTDRARQMLVQLEDSIGLWVAGQLDRAETMMIEAEYEKARAILKKMMLESLPQSMKEKVQKSLEILTEAEDKYQDEKKKARERSHSEQWDQAVWLLNSKKYDEAIEAFRVLYNTSYDVPARSKVDKAAEFASVEMRDKAAALYVRARKEGNPVRKREYFEESWRLLNDITVKYSEVSLIDKVRKYLETIEKQIEAFDPILLHELRGYRGSALNNQSND